MMKKSIYECPVSIGDKVYKIQESQKPVWKSCPLCDGTGKISVKSEERTCPDCYGRTGSTEWQKQEWRLAHYTDTQGTHEMGVAQYTIGQIRLEHTGKKIPEWTAMCKETGIGGGTIHKCLDMFDTVESAQAECDLRNTHDAFSAVELVGEYIV